MAASKKDIESAFQQVKRVYYPQIPGVAQWVLKAGSPTKNTPYKIVEGTGCVVVELGYNKDECLSSLLKLIN